MIYQNTTYRIIYTAKNFVQNLTDVSLVITKPDGTNVGFFVMDEVPGKPGLYYYDYLLDQLGRYIFDCNSTTNPNRHTFAVDVITLPNSAIPIADFDGD